MSIFLVVPTSNPAGVKSALADNKAQGHIDYVDLPISGHFVSYSGTTIELSNLLGVSDGSSGGGVVVAVSSYYGRAPTTMWDWVKSRWDQ